MDPRQLFTHDLNTWVAPAQPGATPAAAADTYSAEVLTALRGILVEIEEASVFIAITTSITGSLLENRSCVLTPQHLAGYVPPVPRTYLESIEGILLAGVDSALVLPVQAYHARLSAAQRLTRAVLDAGPAPSAVIRDAELRKLEESWRHVCGTAIGAIGVLRETLASVRYSRPPVANEHAEALLRSAKSGGRPCIGPDGAIAMPRWAESRTHRRHVTYQAARLLSKGQAKPVLVENVSRTGLGLSGVSGLEAGEIVALEISGGDRLSGRVMWERSGRAGIQLEQMLPPDHMLIVTAGAMI